MSHRDEVYGQIRGLFERCGQKVAVHVSLYNPDDLEAARKGINAGLLTIKANCAEMIEGGMLELARLDERDEPVALLSLVPEAVYPILAEDRKLYFEYANYQAPPGLGNVRCIIYMEPYG